MVNGMSFGLDLIDSEPPFALPFSIASRVRSSALSPAVWVPAHLKPDATASSMKAEADVRNFPILDFLGNPGGSIVVSIPGYEASTPLMLAPTNQR